MARVSRVSLLAAVVLLAALPLVAGTPRIVSNGQWTAGTVAYTYDGSRNVNQIGADQYRYDGAGRLVSGMTNGVTQTYTYDIHVRTARRGASTADPRRSRVPRTASTKPGTTRRET